jgi:RNA polymerase sigma-70 factor (ECF subfamily)
MIAGSRAAGGRRKTGGRTGKMSDAADAPIGRMALARDRALARRMRRGDDRAIDAFCAEYLPKLYRYALRRLGNEADVADVVQVVLINAARRIETYRGEAALLTWLIQICRHEIAKHYADRQRRGMTVELFDDDVLRAMVESLEAPPADEPEALARRAELIDLVQLVLDRLPDRYARVLELKYVEGFTSAEIARHMNIGDVATQSLLARARRAFREICSEAALQRNVLDGEV